MMSMFSPVLDRWVLELQQFDIRFQHIQGKKYVVANPLSRLRMLGLCQDNGNEDVPPTVHDVIKNIIEEVHSTEITPKRPAYYVGKLNLDLLRKDQQWNQVLQKQGERVKDETRLQFPPKQ